MREITFTVVLLSAYSLLPSKVESFAVIPVHDNKRKRLFTRCHLEVDSKPLTTDGEFSSDIGTIIETAKAAPSKKQKTSFSTDLGTNFETAKSAVLKQMPSAAYMSGGFDFKNLLVINGTVAPLSPEMQLKRELKDIADLKSRVQKIEKTVAQSQLGVQKHNPGLGVPQLKISSRSIELCSIFSFFFFGTILGASLLDRLWLLGGISMAYWASGAVNRDTSGGLLARRVGVYVVQFIRDIQEKYNQFVIFYRTGQMAYVTSKIWEQYDDKYGIDKKFKELRRLTLKRAEAFSASFNSDTGLTTQLEDMWKAMQAAPSEAVKLNDKYGVTSGVVGFAKGLASSSYSLLDNMYSQVTGKEIEASRRADDPRYPLSRSSGGFSKKWKQTEGFLGSLFVNNRARQRQRQNMRGNLINPWTSPFQFIKPFGSKQQKKEGSRHIRQWMAAHNPANNDGFRNYAIRNYAI